MLTIKEVRKYSEIITRNKIKCKCGHSITIPPQLNKCICHWCGMYVFRNKNVEFKFRLKEMMNNVKAKS